jgi:hypothetical protein
MRMSARPRLYHARVGGAWADPERAVGLSMLRLLVSNGMKLLGRSRTAGVP